MNRTAAEEVRLVAYFGKTPDPTPSSKSRYEWELAGDDALTPAAEAALVDALRKRIFGQRTLGLVVRIPLFGKSPVSFSGVTLQDLPKKLQGEVASVVAPSGGSRTVSHPNPTNLPEPPRGTMLREFSTPAPDPDSLTARTTKLAAHLPHGSPLRRFLVATVKAACPGHLGNPMQVPPQLSLTSAPGVSCGSCTYFCPTRNVCKAFGDYPVSADMVCAAWQAEGESVSEMPLERLAAQRGRSAHIEPKDVDHTPVKVIPKRIQQALDAAGIKADGGYFTMGNTGNLFTAWWHGEVVAVLKYAPEGRTWHLVPGRTPKSAFGPRTASTRVAKGTPRSFLEQNPTAQVEVMADAGITVIRYNGAKSGKPAAAVYSGKSENPLWDYFFGSESAREQYIADQVEKSKAAMAARQERAQAKRDFQHGMKDGDILYSSWGYDQTQVSWYEVVRTSGKSVALREIAEKVVRSERGAEYVVPVPGHFVGAPFAKIPQSRSGSMYVKISNSQTAYLWDGKPKYQTASGWGH